MTHVTVYTKKGCGPCIATQAALKRLGISFDPVDVTDNDAARASLALEGFQSMPVVKTDTDSWTGFQIDKINELAGI